MLFINTCTIKQRDVADIGCTIATIPSTQYQTTQEQKFNKYLTDCGRNLYQTELPLLHRWINMVSTQQDDPFKLSPYSGGEGSFSIFSP